MKPLLVFDGNCQALHLAAMIRTTGAADTAYVGPDWGFLPAHKGCVARIIPNGREEEELGAAKAAGHKVIQVSQLSAFAKRDRAQKPIAGADKRIIFPELRLWAMSPTRFAESFKSAFDIERIYEIDLNAIQSAQEKTQFPVDMVGFVEREAPKRSLFHTVNHPAGAVFSELIKGLAVLLRDELDGEPLATLADDVEDREGLNFTTDHPVPARVREELGWSWPSTYDTYTRLLLAIEKRDWPVLENCRPEFEALFSEDTKFWHAYALLGCKRKDETIAEPALERLLELCPGVRAPWLLYAQFLKGNGRSEEIPALLQRARALFGDCGIYYSVSSRAYLLAGELTEAERDARRLWESSPSNVNTAFPLIEILLRENRDTEAASFVASLKDRTAMELDILRGMLARKDRSGSLTALLEV